VEQDAQDKQVDRLAAEILRYLRGHPHASDSVEGIAQWWIKRQRLEETLDQVQQALDRLVARSLVQSHTSAAGGTRYSLRADRGSDPEQSGAREQGGGGD
jgi:Fe2+ or Zn2+ uptake regulation protein